MSSSGPTLAQIEVVDIVLTIVAAIVTSFRLCLRTRQRRLWIDDMWAALGMVFIFMLLIADCLYLQDYGEDLPSVYGACILLKKRRKRRYKYHIRIAQFFYAVVWSSRLSILFTVVRLTVPGTSIRKTLISIAITFGVVWALLFSQVWWVCETEPGWKRLPHPQCDLGRSVAIAQIITDVLGDAVLIFAPFSLIYRVRLSSPQKIRVLTVFSASTITTIVSLAHAYYIFSGGGTKEVMAAIVEASVSLIVANLSVVVAFFFHLSAEENSTPGSIVTFGSLPKRRVRDPLATTISGIESTPIVLEDLSEPHPRSLKTRDDDEITLSIKEGRQTKPDDLC
ncbi:uncharacterized protein HD556DRAFT_1443028 [Suillus plorans]|uniref:Rhodopsin domain-containing protein n=1 Tax=Suillus plorans TaxID=116603 RepID=A0A9P7ARZ7_9AGAM|nr:uncharacterized protein HD556DRAFT_1443028 [Suillus plorans]KAG1794460.1 hypothetical protein HD556DRAFT_1443028 [Suillus plorans]